jgi:hypothetical protein
VSPEALLDEAYQTFVRGINLGMPGMPITFYWGSPAPGRRSLLAGKLDMFGHNEPEFQPLLPESKQLNRKYMNIHHDSSFWSRDSLSRESGNTVCASFRAPELTDQ